MGEAKSKKSRNKMLVELTDLTYETRRLLLRVLDSLEVKGRGNIRKHNRTYDAMAAGREDWDDKMETNVIKEQDAADVVLTMENVDYLWDFFDANTIAGRAARLFGPLIDDLELAREGKLSVDPEPPSDELRKVEAA